MKREEELTVSVKPLEWVERRDYPGGWTAETALGRYSVASYDGMWTAFRNGNKTIDVEIYSSDLAKKTAQADYEARIRSASLSTPKPEMSMDDFKAGMDELAKDAIAHGLTKPEATEGVTPLAYVTMAAINTWKAGNGDPQSHVFLSTGGDLRVPIYEGAPVQATEGGAHEKGWQPIDTLPLRALMAKLADLLDEDHFAACEEIVRRAGVAPPTADRLTGDLDDKTIVKLAREHFSEKDYDRLTYEKSPPMFPQATYDVPTYALSQFVKAIRAALTAKQDTE